jgi:ribosomal protein S18 acetylase RimI-like enzyme
MRTVIRDWDEVDVQKLAVLIYEARQAEMERRSITLEKLELWLRNREKPSRAVLALSDDEFIGCILLHTIGDSKLLEMNPGPILGSHPIVSSRWSLREVGTRLIEQSLSWTKGEGFASVYLDIPWSPTDPDEIYDHYREWYESLGFRIIQRVRQMVYDLPEAIPSAEAPHGFKTVQIKEVDQEKLYECHYKAFESSDAQYFFQMTDQDRHEDFRRIHSALARNDDASLALIHRQQVVGYTLVFPEGNESVLDSIGIHPAFRRRGLGELLLLESMRQAVRGERQSMSLICDIQNERASRLYEKVGFRTRGGNITFEWKPFASP